jgi:hypothetical protein
MGNWGLILLPAVFLAFLPLPFDKYLEIRPDGLATVLMLAGVLFQIYWMRWGESRLSLDDRTHRKIVWAVLSGVSYSMSFLTLTKMLPNLLVGAGVAALYVWGNKPTFAPRSGASADKSAGKGRNLRDAWGKILTMVLPFAAGLLAPLLLFGLYVLTLGNPGLVWYSLSRLPVESNKISQWFIMMPTLFFYPNGIFYGADGWNRGLLTNHILWVIGLFVGIYRLVTPYLAPIGKTTEGKSGELGRLQDKNNIALAEILIAGQFLVQVIFYVEIVPLKHAQYLIPIGVFVAWYLADGVLALWNTVKKIKVLEGVFIGLFIVGAVFLYQIFMEVNTVKLSWSNVQTLIDLESLYMQIPKNEPVLDLDGAMLYNPDSYYACCIPFGQFAGFLSRPLPDLPPVLETTNTKYINQGGLKRVGTLPWQWQQYINSHYKPFGYGDAVLVQNDVQQ